MDYVIWLACGFAALLELYIWSLFDKGPGCRARPSEIAGVIFFVLVFGGLSLAVCTLLSVLMILVGLVCFAGHCLDSTYDASKGRKNGKMQLSYSKED
jgi:membrane-bound ClpP family serine protease